MSNAKKRYLMRRKGSRGVCWGGKKKRLCLKEKGSCGEESPHWGERYAKKIYTWRGIDMSAGEVNYLAGR